MPNLFFIYSRRAWIWIRAYYKKLLILFLLFICLPAALAFWLFWFKVDLPINTARGKESTEYTVNTEKLKESKPKNIVSKVFKTPLDLSYYEFCVGNTSKLTETGTGKVTPINVAISVTNKNGQLLKTLEMGGNKKQKDCYAFKIADNIFYVTNSYSISFNPYYQQQVLIDYPSNARPILPEKITLTAVFWLAYLSIAWLFISLYRFCKQYLN